MSKVTKVIDSFYNSNIGKKLANPKATVATAALIATVSNVSKDAVNCAYYTIQSLNNERIPDDQRKFVAALDLSNGIMNVGVQLATAFGLSKWIESFFDNKIAKSKDFSLKEDVLKEKFNKLPEDLTKRIITPLFATPMASFFKEGFEKAEAEKKAKEEHQLKTNA